LRRNLFYGIYLTNFMLYVRRNFKNMTIDLANAFRFCIDIPFAVHFNRAEKILREELKTHDNSADLFLPFLIVYFVFS
jgi:hypothetical protein